MMFQCMFQKYQWRFFDVLVIINTELPCLLLEFREGAAFERGSITNARGGYVRPALRLPRPVTA